jgi:hypothetical protein
MRPLGRDTRVRADQLPVLSGWSLLVTDPLGRVSGSGAAGFYADNTRVRTVVHQPARHASVPTTRRATALARASFRRGSRRPTRRGDHR